MGTLTSKQEIWMTRVFLQVCGSSCYNENAGQIDVVEEGMCGICYSLSNTIITFVPTLVNSLLMSFLPILIDFTVDILGLISM